MNKHPTSIRLSDEAERLLKLLTARLAIGKSAVIELAIRALAKREQVK